MTEPPGPADFASALERRLRGIDARRSRALGQVAAVSILEPQDEIPYEVTGDIPLNPQPADLWLGDAAVEQRLTTAEETAALTGRFPPDALFDEQEPEALRRRVLSRLAPQCEIDGHGERIRWLLLASHRRDIIKRLRGAGALHRVLERPLPPTDAFGQALRDILRHGASLAVEPEDPTRLLALASAIEAVRGTGLPTPDPNDLYLAIGRQSFLAEQQVLTRGGFVGRRQEIATLQKFLEPEAHQGQLWIGLLLSGLGGAGKSTLLAQFVSLAVDRAKTYVAVLDFDRPGIDGADPTFLEREISRQVGYQAPELGLQLREHRRMLRSSSDRSLYVTSELESLERGARSLIAEMAGTLRAHGRMQPLLLILDTFEEVVQRRNVGRVLEWLDDIADQLGPTPLKVIVSGRLMHEADGMPKSGTVQDEDQETTVAAEDRDRLAKAFKYRIVLRELRPQSAERLLCNLGVARSAAKRLARSPVLPRRPLELKLLGRLVLDEPNTDIEALEADFRNGGGRAEALFAGLVYRRVLLRLKDKIAQALASPGLVLRYVTPDLIQNVLVPALDLQPLGREPAKAALDQLASHDWLTYRTSDGAVWHRRDLRRSMLPAMIAEHPEQAKRIHQTAVTFLARSNDPRDRAEATYHRLMLMRWNPAGDESAEVLDLSLLRKASEAFYQDLPDLPPPAMALTRWAKTGSVRAGEVWLLPKRYWREAYMAAGQQAVLAREFDVATSLFSQSAQRRRLLGPSLNRWEADALFATAAWTEVRANSEQRLDFGGSWDKIRAVANTFYPHALISMSASAADSVSRTLEELTVENEPEYEERNRLLRELTVILAVIDALGHLSDKARARCATLVAALRRPPSGPPFDPRHLLLSPLVGESISNLPIRIVPANLRLDPRWLRTLRPAGDEQTETFDTLVSRLERTFEEAVTTGNCTVGRMLARADAVTKAAAPGQVPIKEAVIDRPGLLSMIGRGPDPEFRDPVRYALVDAFDDEPGRVVLAEIIASCLEGNWRDLHPREFERRVSDNPIRKLVPYVEAVDRSWNLGRMLAKAYRMRPHAEKLAQVYAGYHRWNETVDRLWRRQDLMV